MQPNQTVLAFDTSAAHCAAALLSGSRLLRSEMREMVKGQAEALMPMLESMLSDAGLSWKDLSALGVGIGPGNFTGIRIAVSAARGLALGLEIPAVGVSSMEALAEGHEGPCIALTDARRGAVYAQGFQGVALAAQHLTASEFTDLQHTFQTVPLIAAHPLDAPTRSPAMPIAEAIARIAERRAVPDLAPPAPLYLRPADAAPAKPAPALLDK